MSLNEPASRDNEKYDLQTTTTRENSVFLQVESLVSFPLQVNLVLRVLLYECDHGNGREWAGLFRCCCLGVIIPGAR